MLKTSPPLSIFAIPIVILCSLLLSACSHDPAPTENATVWPMLESCDLHYQSCTATNNEQTVRLKISPDPIPIAMPLGIELSIKNISAERIELDISGANMYMGYNRVTLIPEGNMGRYIGTTMLAFCTTEAMEWKITLIIHQKEGKQIHIPYLLKTKMH